MIFGFIIFSNINKPQAIISFLIDNIPEAFYWPNVDCNENDLSLEHFVKSIVRQI